MQSNPYSNWLYNVRMIVEYDGGKFHGWQAQPGLRTVQGELRRVLEIVLPSEFSGIQGSGRTDAGVHALGQVVNFKVNEEISLETLKYSVSSLLKGDLAVLDVRYVPLDFNALHSAAARKYVYKILHRPAPAVLDRGKVWHITSPLDIERMHLEAQTILGTHDFTSFRAAGCMSSTSIKTILESEVKKTGDIVQYSVIGKGFLKQMVRNIVGTLVRIGKNKEKEVLSMKEVLERQDRRSAGACAPAHGLYLEKVFYE